MSDFAEQAKALDADLIARFRRAIEIGRWPDGRVLSDSQREVVMQALIVYEEEKVAPAERTAVMPDQCQSKSVFSEDRVDISGLGIDEHKE